jgi:hypothetical protein
MSDLANLTYSLATASTYEWACVVFATHNTSAGTNLQPVFTGTTASPTVYTVFSINPNNPAYQYNVQQTVYTLTGTATGDTRGTTIGTFFFSGTVTTSSTGTFKIQASQYTSNAAASTIKAGSKCTVTLAQ